MLTLLPSPPPRLPATLAQTRDAILRDAPDHTDATEHMQAIAIVAEAHERVLSLVRGCACAAPLVAVAERLVDALDPLREEATRWDDDRDWRDYGTEADRRRQMAAE